MYRCIKVINNLIYNRTVVTVHAGSGCSRADQVDPLQVLTLG